MLRGRKGSPPQQEILAEFDVEAASEPTLIQQIKSLSLNLKIEGLDDKELSECFFEAQHLTNLILEERKRRNRREKIIATRPTSYNEPCGFEPFRTPLENALKVFSDAYYECAMKYPKRLPTLDNLHAIYLEGAELQISLSVFKEKVIDPLQGPIITCTGGLYEFNNPEHRLLAMREI